MGVEIDFKLSFPCPMSKSRRPAVKRSLGLDSGDVRICIREVAITAGCKQAMRGICFGVRGQKSELPACDLLFVVECKEYHALFACEV